MASAARMVLKPSSHSSITGRRRCSHSNVAGGWTLLRNLGPLSQWHAAAPALADAIHVSSTMRISHELVSSAELVGPWSMRGALSAILALRHK